MKKPEAPITIPILMDPDVVITLKQKDGVIFAVAEKVIEGGREGNAVIAIECLSSTGNKKQE